MMKTIAAIGIACLALAGCASPRDTRMTEGAGIGAVGGAVVAGPVGAVVGGVAGAAVADATRPHYRRSYCHYDQLLGRRVCHYH
jgi:hypothetical protein